MKTTDAVEREEEIAEPEHPFRGQREGWIRMARGTRRPRKLLSTLELVLDPERSAWVFDEAERTGLDAQQVVESLIDRARDVPTVRTSEPPGQHSH
jgi:hypothetical protein